MWLWISFLIVPSSLEIFCDTWGGERSKWREGRRTSENPTPPRDHARSPPKSSKSVKVPPSPWTVPPIPSVSVRIGVVNDCQGWDHDSIVGSLPPMSRVYQQWVSHFVKHHLSGSFTSIICDRWMISQIVCKSIWRNSLLFNFKLMYSVFHFLMNQHY